jgi:gamma-glutamyltranspeptidase / glutathione hydrolase
MLDSLAASGDAASPLRRAEAMAAADAAWRAHGLDAAGLLGLAGLASGGRAVRGTTHVSVIDGEGRAASATVSNGEGNGRIVPGCGFMLNNMLGEADLNPDGFGRWRPGLRLASMMAPTIARRGDGRLLALGSGGSNRIRTAIFQVLADMLLLDRELEAAVAAPRLHVEEDRLDVEAAGEWPDLAALAARFPALQPWPERSLYFGGVHVVERNADGRLSGAGDPRRDGVFLVA